MKKLLILVCLVLSSMAVMAQKGEMLVGINGAACSNLESGNKKDSGVGVGAFVAYSVCSNIQLKASVNGIVINDADGDVWDYNLDVHYILNSSSKLKVYPLVGLTYVNWLYSLTGGSVKYNNLGANVGVGVQYDCAKHIAIVGEAKAQLCKRDNLYGAQIGIAYKF